MAAPHVTGAVALAEADVPQCARARSSPASFLRTATDIGAPGVDDIFGWGLLNVGNLVSTTNSATGSVFTNSAFGRFAAVDTVITTLWDRSAQRIMGGRSGTPVAVAQSQSAYQPAMALGGPGPARSPARMPCSTRAAPPCGRRASWPTPPSTPAPTPPRPTSIPAVRSAATS